MSTIEIVFNTVSALCGVAGMIGGFVAWWHAHASKRAKREAIEARDHAQNIERSLERIARRMQPSPLRVLPLGGAPNVVWLLINDSEMPVTVTRVVNEEQLPGLDLVLPLILEPQTPVEFTRLPVSGAAKYMIVQIDTGQKVTLLFNHSDS